MGLDPHEVQRVLAGGADRAYAPQKNAWELAIKLHGVFLGIDLHDEQLGAWQDVLGAERDRWFRLAETIEKLVQQARPVDTSPVPMILTCPSCHERHIDEGEFATKPHHTHACQSCGMVWRPALVTTVGVRFLPGFKNG